MKVRLRWFKTNIILLILKKGSSDYHYRKNEGFQISKLFFTQIFKKKIWKYKLITQIFWHQKLISTNFWNSKLLSKVFETKN